MSASPLSPRASSSMPRTQKARLDNRTVATRPSGPHSSRRLIVGWAVAEDDEDEDTENEKNGKQKIENEECMALDEGRRPSVDSEKDHFLPKSPAQLKTSQKETRHWTPSKTRHVIISPEMLNEQLDLDSPYNPSPFEHDPDLEKALKSHETFVRKSTQDANGVVVTVTKRKTRWTKFQQTVLNRGYVPLVLRLISLVFAIAALTIAVFITKYSTMGGVETRPSTVMAFLVNGVCLFYLPWVAKVQLLFAL